MYVYVLLGPKYVKGDIYEKVVCPWMKVPNNLL